MHLLNDSSVQGTQITVCGIVSGSGFHYASTEQELRCLLSSASTSIQSDVSSTFNRVIATATAIGSPTAASRGSAAPRVFKRGIAATFPSASGTFSCSVDPTTLSPYQDCINTIAAFCYTASPIFSSWSDCQSKIRTIRPELNSNWKTYISSCAKFLGGDPNSSACSTATSQLVSKEYYYWKDSTNTVRTSTIPQSLISAAVFIWNI